MSKGPIRRGQLIAPFGPGAMVVVKDGTSVVSCGLDKWFLPEGGPSAGQEIDIEEYKIEEWRLQRLLAVNHLRLPPDFRRKQRGQNIPNTGLTVPFLRFPKWHFCPFCKVLAELPPSAKSSEPCRECLAKGKKRNYLVQVPFIVICDRGHLQDFPWREWVHHSFKPACDRAMRLVATGGASLADQRVVCECGVSRSLANITTADTDGNDSFLSKNLDSSGRAFRCEGSKPWLGDGQFDSCDRPLRGSLRSASNVYYARVHSAIYLPRSSQGVPAELVTLFRTPPLSTLINFILSSGKDIAPDFLRQQHRELLKPFSDTEIKKSLSVVLDKQDEEDLSKQSFDGEPHEVTFRRAEFNVLRKTQTQDELSIHRESIANYSGELTDFFSAVSLVNKLRETRAFSGFSRVFPDDLTTEQHKGQLSKNPLAQADSWLPAYIVYGEGVFLELNEARLQSWEIQPNVISLVTNLRTRYQAVQQMRRLRDVAIEPRFVLLHTLAHILINKLTFECGYGSAALRERLYVSSERAAPMAGVLIYTAAGDSEGTMGGLVRMGKPDYLEPIIKKALRDAEWCSADPVCMEIGIRQGQGPDSCNLAACHNCALVPETSCENFNRFLDRTLLIGSREDRRLGFFSSLV